MSSLKVLIPRGAVDLRPATVDDYDFMRRLYESAREEEMKLFPFDDAQKRAFLDQQFSAQTAHYALHYPTCDRRIIENEGRPIGRLFVDRWRDQIRIVDIALLSECRGTGLGTALVVEILAEGRREGKPVTIHVEGFNPALRMYRRLGFEQVDTNGVYYLLRWLPDQVKTAS